MDLAAPRVQQTGPNSYAVTHGDDAQLWVTFENVAVKQDAESEKAGRPIYKDVPHIHIRFPGDKTREILRPVRLTPEQSQPHAPDPERFPRQWAAFERQQEVTVEGTPIEQWAPLSKGQALELKAINIHSVEMLANLSDSGVGALGMGGLTLRDKARAWLKQAGDGSEVSRLSAENAALKADMETLKRQFAELAGQASEKRGPGRPKKDEAA